MPRLINLKTISDQRGSLTVAQDEVPFTVQRIFFVHDVTESRGGHRHRKNLMALIALGGSIQINVQTPSENLIFVLDHPNKCLLLNPEDWHTMTEFTPGSTLCVLASEKFDKNDYIYESYRA